MKYLPTKKKSIKNFDNGRTIDYLMPTQQSPSVLLELSIPLASNIRASSNSLHIVYPSGSKWTTAHHKKKWNFLLSIIYQLNRMNTILSNYTSHFYLSVFITFVLHALIILLSRSVSSLNSRRIKEYLCTCKHFSRNNTSSQCRHQKATVWNVKLYNVPRESRHRLNEKLDKDHIKEEMGTASNSSAIIVCLAPAYCIFMYGYLYVA